MSDLVTAAVSVVGVIATVAGLWQPTRAAARRVDAALERRRHSRGDHGALELVTTARGNGVLRCPGCRRSYEP